jgi:hypothetical protein
MNHATSDEAIAVYGVVGKTRKVNVHHNRIYGLDVDPNQIVFYNTLVSVFPLKHSTLGANAAVEDVLLQIIIFHQEVTLFCYEVW